MQKITTSTLTTPRKPIKKLTQLNEKEQLHCLELFNTHTFKVTEKVDGMALRLYLDKDKMLFESSYSGLVEKHNFIFPAISGMLDKMSRIKNLFDYPIKLSGELIWNCGIDKNKNVSTFAPVCTKYTPSIAPTGSYFVIFDMYKVENNELVLISDNEFKQNMLDISFAAGDEDAVQYVNGKSLTYDFSDIQSRQFSSFNSLLKLLEFKIDSLQSHLCEEDIKSPIEGIVITFDNGEQYGIFSSKYKSKKGSYYQYFKQAEEAEKEFKKNVYGYCTKSAIIKHQTHFGLDTAKKYNENKDNTIDIINAAQFRLRYSNIPRSCKEFQTYLLQNMIEKIKNNDPISYIERNLCYL